MGDGPPAEPLGGTPPRGLFDKVKDKLSSLTPDHTAAVQERLGTERLLAHIGGGEGTLAHSLPRGTEPMMLALAEGSVTLWKLAMGKGAELEARVERGEVASIGDTGNRRARGHVRLSFTDESFFDYQTLAAPSADFWAAADGFGAV